MSTVSLYTVSLYIVTPAFGRELVELYDIDRYCLFNGAISTEQTLIGMSESPSDVSRRRLRCPHDTVEILIVHLEIRNRDMASRSITNCAAYSITAY